MRSTKVLHARVTEPLRDAVDRARAQTGQPLAEWIREVITAALVARGHWPPSKESSRPSRAVVCRRDGWAIRQDLGALEFIATHDTGLEVTARTLVGLDAAMELAEKNLDGEM